MTIINYIISTQFTFLDKKIHSYEMNILLLIALLGSMLLVSSNHFITVYLAIELQSLSFYILTSTQRKSMGELEEIGARSDGT